MKKINIIITTLMLLLPYFAIAQINTNDTTVVHALRELTNDAYSPNNHTGIAAQGTELADLQKVANELRDLIIGIAPNFKVFDYGSYPILTQMGKEADNNKLFTAMEANIAAMTPKVEHYLLIGKHIDSESGKVSFKVKVKLPITANLKSDDPERGLQAFSTTFISKLEEEALNEINDYPNPPYGHFEAQEKEGVITIKKMIEKEQTLQFSAWYRPDGYIFAHPQTKTGHYIDYIISGSRSFPTEYKNGFVYGWKFLDKKDGNVTYEKLYKAVIKNGLFYGYYENGAIDNSDLTKGKYTDDGNVYKNQKVNVGAVDYITTQCGGVEWRQTEYNQISTDYPAYPTPLKNDFKSNTNLTQGFGYLSESVSRTQIFYRCSSSKATTYEQYFTFKMQKDNLTAETIEKLQEFCNLLASDKDKLDEFFKSKASIYKGTYVYYSYVDLRLIPNNMISTKAIPISDGPSVQFLKFIEQVFLPDNPNSWIAKDFTKAGELITAYKDNIALQIESGKVRGEISFLGSNNVKKYAYLFLAAEHMTSLKKVQRLSHVGVALDAGEPLSYFKPILLHTQESAIPELINLLGIATYKHIWKLLLASNVSNEDNLVIAEFLTLQKAKVVGMNQSSITKPAVEVPFNVMDILAGSKIDGFNNNSTLYDLTFNAASWRESEFVINYLPFTGGYQKGVETVSATGLNPLDVIILRASNEQFKGADNISFYQNLKLGESDMYIVSPYMLDIEHRIDNGKRNAFYVEVGVTVASVVLLVPEVQAARLAYIEGHFIKAGVKATYAVLDAGVFAINTFPKDIVTSEDKNFINNSYLFWSLFRLGSNLAFNKFFKSSEGQAVLTKYFGQCDDAAAAAHADNWAKTVAKRMLIEYGHLNPGVCFTEGTLIKEEHQPTPIEKIKENDRVWSWDFEKNTTSLQRVVRTFQRTTNQLVHLFVGKEIIHTTPEHPFYTGSNWINAADLRKGAKVFLFSTLLASIDSTYAQDTVCTVYNFDVENTHNYYVGEQGVLVHNTCIDELGIGCTE